MPVIFLTANDAEVNVVMGLEMGADDYICKPFRINELMARIKTVLRRTGNRQGIGSISNGSECGTEIGANYRSAGTTKGSSYGNGLSSQGVNGVISIQNIRIHTNEARVGIVDGAGGENMVELTALEYRLLLAFCNNRGVVLSRNQLLADMWDVDGDFVNDNTLTVYIKRLRDKIEEDPAAPKIIKTVRGMGYILEK